MKMADEKHIRVDGDKLAIELGYSSMDELMQEMTRMSMMDPGDLIPEELSDLTEIEIDASLTVEERALSLLRQTRNPYYYRYEDMIVTISAAEKRALEDFLANCLFRKKGRSE